MTALPEISDRPLAPAALPPAPLTGEPGVPFERLLRAELRKLVDTRAGKWLMIAILAATPIVVVVTLFVAKAHNLTYDKFVNMTQTPQKFLLPVIGILTVTTEWSQRTGLVTFALAPQRGRVLRAKAVAMLLTGLTVLAVAFSAAAIGNLLAPGLRHGNGSWSFGVSGFRDLIIVQLTGLVQGMAFGMLLLISAPAVIAYFVLPTLSTFAFGSVSGRRWFDLNSAQIALYDHDITARGWAQLGTAVAIWVVTPAVLGVTRVLRREIKTS